MSGIEQLWTMAKTSMCNNFKSKLRRRLNNMEGKQNACGGARENENIGSKIGCDTIRIMKKGTA